MSRGQTAKTRSARRGLLARPLDALVFLLPLILLYEVASLTRANRVIAFDLIQNFFQLFGEAGVWAPGLGVVVILLATHFASGEPWKVHWRVVCLMYVEAVVLALPLLALNWAIPLAGSESAAALINRMAMGIGAGIYEELVFRLMLISFVILIGVDILKLDRTGVAGAAIILSAVAFAAHHHQPIGREPFALTPFAFRAFAGGYLSIVFWYRGYGPAAGCHAAYNVLIAVLGASAP